jgi:hypothetical protein
MIMAWEVFIEPQYRGSATKYASDTVVIKHEKSSGGSTALSVAFRIGSDVVSAMRWQAGDKVTTVRNGDIVGIKRVSAKTAIGWTLTKASSGKNLRFKCCSKELLESLPVGVIANPIVDGDVLVLGEVKRKAVS